LYASYAPFGGNVVGLKAASWRYFGRGAHQLSWAENALLAVLPNSPSLIHPGRNRKRLKQKRDSLLQRLRDSQVISSIDYELATSEPLPDQPHPLPRIAPHLTETLNQQDSSFLQKASSLFDSTLDFEIQKNVQSILQRHAQHLQERGIYNECGSSCFG